MYTSYVGGIWSLWLAGPDGADRSPLLTAQAGETIGFPSVSDDGTLYYALRSRSGTEVRSAARDGSGMRVVTREARFDATGVTHDGKTLVFGALVGAVPQIFRVGTDGGERTPVSSVPAFASSLDPSGKRVAFYYVGEDGRISSGCLFHRRRILDEQPGRRAADAV